MRRAPVLLVLMLLIVVGVAACAPAPDSATPAEDSHGAASEAAGADEEAEPESAGISLPDGWTMDSIITADEVGAITGKKMTYFPEAASAAQDGKPKAGYTNDGQPNTKLYVAVDVAGGEEGFKKEQGFADSASIKPLDGVGDEAVTCAYTNGRVGVLVLRGDAVIRIDWPTAVYGDDAAGIGGDLAKLLLGKMFE